MNVPRVSEVTGRKTVEQLATEREQQRARSQFVNDTRRYGFGTREGREAWKRRVQATRSF